MDLAARVGLQLLLDPGSSAPLFRAGCTAVGVVYPVYESFKALDNTNASTSTSASASTSTSTSKQASASQERQEELLVYWAIWGCLSLVEHEGDRLLRVIPYYYHAKFGFLLWLMLPQTQGARVLYQKYVQPALRKYRPKVDVILQRSHDMAAAVYTMYKVPLDATSSAVSMGLTQARSFVVWFTDTDASPRDPKGKAADKRAGGQFLVN